MLKRMLEISRDPAYLSASLGQILIQRHGQLLASVPAEDLGVVVVDHPQTTYSHSALTELLKNDAVLVICGPNHLPCGILLPISDHSLIVTRMNLQLTITLPTKKRLWQQLIKAKIYAQAENLSEGSKTGKRLWQIAKRVKSGDPDNREALAARFYWSAWLMESDQGQQQWSNFRRDPDGTGVNSLLNYGYSIVRASLARAISSSGFQPALGLRHSNRSNAFCLADDLIEPLRPMVDELVRELIFSGETELTQPVKASLLELLNIEVQTGEISGPLSIAIHRYVSSLISVAEGKSRDLTIPVRCKSAAIAVCG